MIEVISLLIIAMRKIIQTVKIILDRNNGDEDDTVTDIVRGGNNDNGVDLVEDSQTDEDEFGLVLRRGEGGGWQQSIDVVDDGVGAEEEEEEEEEEPCIISY